MKDVLASFGRGATRLFRCNAGTSWQGLEVARSRERLTLENPRAVHGWPPGSADLVGWQSVVVTPEMVGQYLTGNYMRAPISMVRGEGSYLWDAEGKRYLDLLPGLGVDGLGVAKQRCRNYAAN